MTAFTYHQKRILAALSAGEAVDEKTANGWQGCEAHRALYLLPASSEQLRVAPQTLLLEGAVPVPMRCRPAVGSTYWAPDLLAAIAVVQRTWDGDAIDDLLFRRGLAHAKMGAAQDHARNLIAATAHPTLRETGGFVDEPSRPEY